MNPISFERFSALAGYSRRPHFVPTVELEWHEEQNERLLGVIIIEAIDNEYGGIVLGRDANGCFRWVDGSRFSSDITEARAALEEALRNQSQQPDEAFHQGDEYQRATNLLDPVAPPEQTHPVFRELITDLRFTAARAVIDKMSPYFHDLDGNFVQQFQTTGFDARLFELYLFAALHEIGYAFDESHNAPDYHCMAPGIEFFIEAVTANPTDGTTPLDPTAILEKTVANPREYFEGEVAVKIASPLYSKLQKKYWERPHVAGKPLVFAIQNFSAPLAMMQTSTALGTYLYGWRHIPSRDGDGHLIVTPERVTEHRHGDKVIPSNFFALPGAENVSAVIFNPHATISKINRMGVIAGFGSDRVKLLRVGEAQDHNPDAAVPIPFSFDVQSPDYSEAWIEGMSVYHNPNALYPLDPNLLPGCAHHFSKLDGTLVSHVPEFFPMNSVTNTLVLTGEQQAT